MNKWRFRENIVLSIVIHCLLLLGAVWAPKFVKPPVREIIEMTLVTPPPPPPVAVAPPPPPPKVILQEKKQVVEQDEKPVNEEVPDNDKFLSEHNQVVKKQTVAKNLGEFRNKKMDAKSDGDGGKNLKLTDFKPKMDFTKLVEKKKQEELDLEKSLDENAIKVADQKAKPTPKDTASEKPGTGGAAASQTTDYLKDVDQGMETLLSTKEFVYYSFYARIRRQLNQHWGGKVREKLSKIFKEGRTIASTDDKVTKVLITLNRAGQLVKVQVLNDSGIRDLDEAAIEAFKEAAPFPNPPEGIVEPDGTIKIRWDFILEA